MARSRFNYWVISLLIVIGSAISYGIALLNQNIDKVEAVAENSSRLNESNNRFLINFSDYLRCILIRDEKLLAELGTEKYYDHCEVLLFRGTGLKP